MQRTEQIIAVSFPGRYLCCLGPFCKPFLPAASFHFNGSHGGPSSSKHPWTVTQGGSSFRKSALSTPCASSAIPALLQAAPDLYVTPLPSFAATARRHAYACMGKNRIPANPSVQTLGTSNHVKRMACRRNDRLTPLDPATVYLFVQRQPRRAICYVLMLQQTIASHDIGVVYSRCLDRSLSPSNPSYRSPTSRNILGVHIPSTETQLAVHPFDIVEGHSVLLELSDTLSVPQKSRRISAALTLVDSLLRRRCPPPTYPSRSWVPHSAY
jgi:hypothetical protein